MLRFYPSYIYYFIIISIKNNNAVYYLKSKFDARMIGGVGRGFFVRNR